MAGSTAQYGLATPTDGEADPATVVATALNQIEDLMGKPLTITIDNSNAHTLTSGGASTEFDHNFYFQFDPDGGSAPTAAITVTCPTIQRGLFVVFNNTAQDLTPTITGQAVTAETVAAGERALYVSDGSNVLQIGGGGGGGGGGVSTFFQGNTDVTGTETNGDVAKFNGTNWEPVSLALSPGSPVQYAKVGLTADLAAANYTTETVLSWTRLDTDTDGGIADIGGANPSRLTVPSDATRVRLSTNIATNGITGGDAVRWYITRNGATAFGDNEALGTNWDNADLTTTGGFSTTGIVNVTAGDYFEVVLRSGAETTIGIDSDPTYFEMEVIERSGQNIRTVLEPVVVAAQSNINLSTDAENGDTIDGVTLATGDRIIAPAQTTTADRGVYIVQASGAAVRAADNNSNEDFFLGQLIPVIGGTDAGQQYMLTSGETLAAAKTYRLTVPLPRGHIDGFITSNDTDADHDINVTAGQAYANDASTINLGAEITKQIDASWAAGDDAGGLSSSLTLATNTTYHVFAIVVGGVADIGFDTSVTAANLIADHSATSYRRIWSVITDGTSNILPYTQVNETCYLVDPDSDTTTASNTQANVTLPSIPTGISVRPRCLWGTDTQSQRYVVGHPDQTLYTPGEISSHAFIAASNARRAQTHMDDTYTNTSAQVAVRANAAATNVTMNVFGWIDDRGKE